jgi:hypothetical protein
VLAELGDLAAVVAIYHPKPPRDVTPEQVREHARAIGMPGTLGIDRDWAVLDRWKPSSERGFTSLTFFLDKRGRVRHVHPGGAIEPAEAGELRAKLQALLAE